MHRFESVLRWIGAADGPTTSYRSYSREYVVEVEGKPPLRGSAAPPFLGDGGLLNPEDLLVAALSACHCLSYLAVCARVPIEVVDYRDRAEGTMAFVDGAMRFTEVVLRPEVTIAAGQDEARALALHAKASAACFIRNSVSFPVRHRARIVVGDAPSLSAKRS